MTMWTIPEELTRSVQNDIATSEQERQRRTIAQEAQQGDLINLQQQQAGDIYQDAFTAANSAYQQTRQQIQAQQSVLNKQLSQIDPRYKDERGYINSQQALLDLQRSQLQPAYADQKQVFKAQQALLTAQSSQYQLEVQQLEERKGELQQMIAAEEDIGNQTNVARGLQQRQAFDPRYQAAGVAPIEVQRPLDAEAPENLPPGVRYAIETDAQRLGREFERTGAQRGLALEGSQLGTAQAGLGVTGAQLTKAQADAQRQLQLSKQQISTQGAGLNLSLNDLQRQRELAKVQGAATGTGLQVQRSAADLARQQELAAAERRRLLSQQQANVGLAGLGLL